LEISLSGIVGIVGNYGSGKTEVSINLAVNRKRAGLDVRLADLDLVNPYFRTREARTQLEQVGIDVILPPQQYLHADLPVLSPVIAGMIKRTDGLTLLDVGGDDAGAMVLAALADAFKDVEVHLLQVVNPMRPATGTIEGCLKIRKEIEKAAKLRITGLIGNANLIEETDADEIYSGYEFVRKLSAESGLPLEFITVADKILSRIELERFACPVLTIARQLVPPWLKAGKFEVGGRNAEAGSGES
jgi:MinD-like ATPase involved in chromosome partitioning or flagellar assembly